MMIHDDSKTMTCAYLSQLYHIHLNRVECHKTKQYGCYYTWRQHNSIIQFHLMFHCLSLIILQIN